MSIVITKLPLPIDQGCDQGVDKRQSDLCAQWKAADATERAARYALFALIVSGIGTLFLYLTLRNQRQTSRAELRAYVNVDAAQIGDGTQDPQNPQPFVGAIWAIKNTGNTPAYNLRHWGEIAFCTFQDQESLVPPRPLPAIPENVLPKDGSNRKFRQMRKLTQRQIAAFRKGKASVFIYGRIEYRDVFGKKRFTEYRLHYAGRWPPPEQNLMFFSDRGNESD